MRFTSKDADAQAIGLGCLGHGLTRKSKRMSRGNDTLSEEISLSICATDGK